MSIALSLAVIDGEPRIDSRLVSNELGVDHKSARKLIEQYSADFEELGVWRFEIAKPCKDTLGGRPEKFYLLNEDQCYFLMTLVRNTDEAVQLKKRLVKAFAEYRQRLNTLTTLDEIDTLRQKLGACQAELIIHKPVWSKIAYYKALGLNQTEIGLLIHRSPRHTRRQMRRLEACGLLSRPQSRQISLLEG